MSNFGPALVLFVAIVAVVAWQQDQKTAPGEEGREPEADSPDLLAVVARARVKQARDLFERWHAARPFLHVTQSEYSINLVLAVITELEAFIFYASLAHYDEAILVQSKEALESFKSLLHDNPPPDTPPDSPARRGCSFCLHFR